MNNAVCTCGNTEDHVIARRSTADGKHVCLWSDGSLTWALGFSIKGSARPRTAEARRLALCAGWLVLGEVCVYDAAEVGALVRAARRAAQRDGLPGTLRRYVSAPTTPRDWTILQADRDGRPTCRILKLTDGVAIWHERGKYEIMYEVSGSSGTYRTSGISGPSLKSISDHIS